MQRAILVGVDRRGKLAAADGTLTTAEESLEELKSLAATAGAEVLASVLQARSALEASTLIGSGKVEELAGMVKGFDAGLVIFDNELTPTQQRNLERAFDVMVIDRTQLILDIFAARARTREGQLQVELAQLSYLLPRLAGRGVMMSRQGGGIGTRGPGETQLETDRRKIASRIKKIERELDSVKAGRAIQRRQRVEVPLATISLVGYTNAGKSTLFNRLTRSDVEADSRMFATLDPTVRQLVLPSRRQVLVSDTVGFIRNLPTTLVKAFRATLEEVRQAAMLLHVVDVSSPAAAAQTAQVMDVLREIDSDQKPQILVLNKADLLPGGDPDTATVASRLLGERADAAATRVVATSARAGQGMSQLLAAIDEALPGDRVTVTEFRFPLTEGGAMHLVHERARVLSSRFEEDSCRMTAEAPESLRRRLEKFVVS